MAMVGGATYVARRVQWQAKNTWWRFSKAPLLHRGFALVDVFSPCVTYNKDNTYQFFNPRVKILEKRNHDPADFHKALDEAYKWGDESPLACSGGAPDLPTLEDQESVLQDGHGPLAFRELGISDEQAQAVIQELL